MQDFSKHRKAALEKARQAALEAQNSGLGGRLSGGFKKLGTKVMLGMRLGRARSSEDKGAKFMTGKAKTKAGAEAKTKALRRAVALKRVP